MINQCCQFYFQWWDINIYGSDGYYGINILSNVNQYEGIGYFVNWIVYIECQYQIYDYCQYNNVVLLYFLKLLSQVVG